MDVVNTRRMLRQICASSLGNDGFRFFAKREAFRKCVDAQIQWLCHFRVIRHGGRVLIEPSFSIRHLEIERLFHDAKQTQERFRDGTSVLWVRAHHLMQSGTKEILFIATTEESVVEIANSYLDLYDKYATPFFRSNSTLVAMDRILNGNPDEYCPYNNAVDRCFFGAIVAIQVRGKAAQPVIERHRIAIAKQDSGYHIAKFDAMVETLMSLTTASGSVIF